MLTSNPNPHSPFLRLTTISNSSKQLPFSQFSALCSSSCNNSSLKDFNFLSVLSSNVVSRNLLSRKRRIRTSKWSFNKFALEASLSAQEANKFGIQEEEAVLKQPSAPFSVKIPVGHRHIIVETGHIGRQASAAVTVTDGETIIYTTVCMSDTPSEPTDFFPLTVNYQERFSAAGRTSGGFFKREGRAKDHEVLICRLIDRPLRPTMPKGFYHETQILSWVLSYDGVHPPDSLAVTAAGIAVALSEVPNSKAIAGVRIGLIDDKFVVNPTTKEIEDLKLDLLLAGTDDAILMIEKLLEAVEVGQNAVRAICKEVESLVKKCGKSKLVDAIKLPPPELYRHVEEIAGDELVEALQIQKKIPRRKVLSSLEGKVLTILTEEGFVSKTESAGVTNESVTIDLLEDEEDDEEVVVDGEVDEGDVQLKPVLKKPVPAGLCHISELSADWLAKAEDAFKIGDRLDVKLIEINEKGQLRLSRRALLPESNSEKSGTKQRSDKPRKTLLKDVVASDAEFPRSESSDGNVEDKFVKRLVSSGKDASETDKRRYIRSGSTKRVTNNSRESESAI